MSFVTCGINYQSAPIDLREKLVFHREQLPASLWQLQQQQGIKGAVILSTCHRTEMYCEMENHPTSPGQQLSEWLASHRQLSAANLSPYLYVYENEQTVKHVFRVTSGLDSMILGEPQIFGQIKEAVAIADKTGTLGKTLRRLFHYAFSVGKQVRTDTSIGENAVTLGYAVVQLARRIFADLSQCRVLLLGAGETIQLVAKHLHGQGLTQFCIANRTAARADTLASLIQADVITMTEFSAYLSHADIIVSAVHSALPVIGKGITESALKARKHRPMLMVDLAMPRNIEPEIQQLNDVYLYTLDDLQTLLEENRHKRKDAVAMAETIIEAQAAHFMADLRVMAVAKTIQSYRQQMYAYRDDALAHALHALTIGSDPKDIMKKLAYQLTNKLLHYPCATLRQAAYTGDWTLQKP